MIMDSGYTKFPNLLFDWLLAMTPNLSKREITVLLSVIRNTIGWNKEKAPLSCRYIAGQTGMKPGHVSETIHALEERGLILVDRSKQTAIIGINPAAVQSVPKSGTVQGASVPESGTEVFPNQEQKCSQIGNESVPESGTNKERKDNINTKAESSIFDQLF